MARVTLRGAGEDIGLSTGDRMTQAEFHELYKRTPADFRAELIGGIVYVSSPLKRRHGTNHLALGALFFAYQGSTPGVESGDNATVVLGEEEEPQPDLYLRVLPEFGGQSQTSPDDYIVGAPELTAEIAESSRALDLHAKLLDYARCGVREYLVVCLREREVRWFDLPADEELHPDPDGVCRMRVFPGLWIHVEALLANDYGQRMTTLQQGLATPEHAAFAASLTAFRPPRRGAKGGGRKRPPK